MGKKLWLFVLAAVVIGGYQVYQKTAAGSGPLPYEDSWLSAIDATRSTDKPILLVFGGDW